MPERTRGAAAVTDATLVHRMLRGDDSAFDAFFKDYFPRLYRFAVYRVGQDADAAEEIVQATMIKAIRRLHTWQGRSTLFTWLCAICRNEIASWRDRTGRHEIVRLAEDAPEMRDRLASIAAQIVERPDAAFERQEVSRLVQVALDALPARYADVLEWKYLQGLGVAEIATRLETGEKAAESLLTRARRAFRDAFTVLTPHRGEIDG
jgi:RNA polymerase sigma-70 factor (ECF subfamily)